MIALFQRVKYAKLRIAEKLISEIKSGLLIFIGVEKDDSLEDMKKIAGKISKIRLFEDQDGKMNLPLSPDQEILLVSQFTLLGTVKGCHRPDFGKAERAEQANTLFEHLASELQQAYQQFNNVWLSNERVVRNTSMGHYGAIETAMALMRVAIESSPPNIDKIKQQSLHLKTALDSYNSGGTVVVTQNTHSLNDGTQLLREGFNAFQANNINEGQDKLTRFIPLCPYNFYRGLDRW